MPLPPKKLLLLFTVYCLLFIVTAVSTYFILTRNKTSSASLPPPLIASPSATFAPLPTDADSLTALLLGYGGAGHQGGFLTDALMLVHADLTKKTLAFISIPRDLWVPLPSGTMGKINSVFAQKTSAAEYPTQPVNPESATQGAGTLTPVITTVTGLTPNYYIGIDFTGFVTAVDKLGGLDVAVPETFTDEYYPIKGKELEPCEKTPEEITELSHTLSGFELEKKFKCRYETISFTKGIIHLDGTTSLKFVRSRHSPTAGSDFSRSLRQQALLEALLKKLISIKALQNAPALFGQVTKAVRTNLDEAALKTIAAAVTDLNDYQVVKINLNTTNVLVASTSANGALILLPKAGDNNWQLIRQYIENQLNL